MTGRLDHLGTGGDPAWARAPGQAVLAEALRWAWAGVYRISGTSGSYEAWRLDRSGSVHAATAEELRDAILADYAGYAAGV